MLEFNVNKRLNGRIRKEHFILVLKSISIIKQKHKKQIEYSIDQDVISFFAKKIGIATHNYKKWMTIF